MTVSLADSCRLTAALTGCGVHLLRTEAQRDEFCRAHRFHSTQSYLTRQGLRALLRELTPETILCITDCFRLRVVIGLAGETPVAMGPYCTQLMGERELRYLFPRQELPFPPLELLAFRGQFPEQNHEQVVRWLQTLLAFCGGQQQNWILREVDYSLQEPSYPEELTAKPLAEVLEERYRLEQQMYAYLRQGRAGDTVEAYRQLERRVAYYQRLYATAGDANRVGAAMVRNAARLAAYDAGLPAILLDRICSATSQAIGGASTQQEIYQLVEELLRNLCHEIRRKQNRQYSKLVLCLMYAVEHGYQDKLTVSGLAAELGVSDNHLIRRCRAELGMTPNAYLRQVRMERAQRLLRETTLPVQEIAQSVGIDDANYFAKLFRQTCGQTPTAYRAARAL